MGKEGTVQVAKKKKALCEEHQKWCSFFYNRKKFYTFYYKMAYANFANKKFYKKILKQQYYFLQIDKIKTYLFGTIISFIKINRYQFNNIIIGLQV